MPELVRSEIKSAAREQMRGKTGFIIISFIIYMVITGGVGWTGIGFLLLGGPLTVGLLGLLLMIARGSPASYNNLFDGFKQFLNNMVGFLLVTIQTVLWSLLLIVPGILAAIRYSQTFYILADNPGMEANAALQKSKAMMQGHKGEFFMLGLSFILWFLLGTITLGIAFIWIGPYMSMTFANYYEWLKKQST